jgi:subtilisin family serine protease
MALFTAALLCGHEAPRRKEESGGVKAREHWLGCVGLTPLALALAGCGGSGGGGVASTPPPVAAAPTPAPTPAPAPAPTPSFNANTAEARRTNSFAFHGAVTAYNQNVTGQGVTIGVIDSGIDADSAEFSGRIHPQSFDATGNGRSIDGEGSHGTQVAQIAAGAKNDVGTFGMAFGATLLVLRADRPGSCGGTNPDATADDCRYPESAITAGIDRAISVGARVINISLGGDTPPGSALRQAVARATAAGIIVVLSAGNEGDSTEGGNDPNNPEPFAQGMRDAGGALVMIAGSVDEARAISAFSNRAGSYADSYLTALGDGLCCVYENGALKTEVRPEGTFVFLLNGTSFSAPQIAGAAALVAQAFPGLSGAQIVQLLYQSARDAGASGTDPIFGRGILDVGRAFAPVGATSLAGTTTAFALGTPIGSLGPAMGDARASAVTLIRDGFGRSFAVDLGPGWIAQPQSPRLLPALDASAAGRVAARGPTALSLSFLPGALGRQSAGPAGPGFADGRARALAASMVTRLGANDRLGVAAGRSLDGVLAGERGLGDAALLLAPRGGDATAPLRDARLGALWRHDGGRWGWLSLSAESGRVAAANPLAAARRRFAAADTAEYQRLALGWDRRFGPLTLMLGAARLREEASLLGARFGPLIGARGATSFEAQGGARLRLGAGWSLAGEWTALWTRPDSGGLVSGGLLRATGWSLDAARPDLLARGDRLTLRYAQPLRVGTGGLDLVLPVAEAADGAVLAGPQRLALAPTGRERVAEAGYRLPLGSATLLLNSWWRRDPAHFAAADDDIGGAIRFTLGY